MGRVSRYLFRKPGLFVLAFLGVFLSQLLLNVVTFTYVETVKLRGSWRERFVVRAFFRGTLSSESMDGVRLSLATHPLVERVVFVSPEEAKERLQNRLGLGEEEFPETLLPASLEIYLKNIEDLPDFVRGLQKNDAFEEVLYGGREVESFLRLLRLLTGVGGVFLLFVLGFAVFVVVVVTAFGVRLRSREVRVLSLVGATEGFSRAPFLWEGFLSGLCGGIGAFVVSVLFLAAFLRLVEGAFPGFVRVNLEEVLLPLFLLDLTGGCGVGILGASLGFWKARRET